MTDSVLMEVDNDPQVEKRKADKGKAPMSAADERRRTRCGWRSTALRAGGRRRAQGHHRPISRLSTEDKLPHLVAAPGHGQTSTILALAKELYGASFAQMVLELNAPTVRA